MLLKRAEKNDQNLHRNVLQKNKNRKKRKANESESGKKKKALTL